MNFPILSSLILLPVIGSLFLLFSKDKNSNTGKYVALFTSFVNFLISVYDETYNDDYTKELVGWKTVEEAKKKIAIHVDLFSNKLYRGSTPQMSFNLKGDDTINLAYLMYLDMLHDKTIP